MKSYLEVELDNAAKQFIQLVRRKTFLEAADMIGAGYTFGTLDIPERAEEIGHLFVSIDKLLRERAKE